MRHLAGTISARFKGLDERRLILGSGMFDAEWYARTYPDAGNSREALTHFITRGASRRNDPSPDFSTSAYLAANPDVQASGINALVHYLKFGRKEGRGIRGGEDGGLAPLGTVAMQRIADAFDAGGGDGAPGRVELDDGTQLRAKGRQHVPEGRQLILALPGGGGFGDPGDRGEALVAQDEARGYTGAKD